MKKTFGFYPSFELGSSSFATRERKRKTRFLFLSAHCSVGSSHGRNKILYCFAPLVWLNESVINKLNNQNVAIKHFIHATARGRSMKSRVQTLLFISLIICLTGCSPFTKVQKSSNREYKYEMAKAYFIEGKYSNAQTLFEELLAFMKGSSTGEESLYMLAMSYYNQQDYVTAAQYLQTYCSTYPKGLYSEEARYHTVKALFLDTPDPRLDQSSTIRAISEIQVFIEFYPYSGYKPEVQRLLYILQDRLVEKEYRSALLYYDLGNYMGNNYQACIITAQNALHDYPYTKFREDLSFLVLKAKYAMAKESVKEKMLDRYRDTVDEYYAFKNEFPESPRMKDADKILSDSEKAIKHL